MRIARWRSQEGVVEGFVIDDLVVPFPGGARVSEVLRAGLDAAAKLFDTINLDTGVPLAEVRLLAPLVPASVRDFAVFEEHVEGMSADEQGNPRVGEAWYDQPTFYFTNPHRIFGHGESIHPPETDRLDYELEVAAVIGGVPGSSGENLGIVESAAHIFGYTIMNDWSARDIQNREMRVGLGPAKGKDFATSLGPWIVTADELDSYIDDDGFLAIRAEVFIGDRCIGHDLLSNMAWTFAELVAYAARASRVEPGDVLGSGTTGNGGCLGELWGKAGGTLVVPPLREGDTVRMVVEGIGELAGVVGSAQPSVPIPRARVRSAPRARLRTEVRAGPLKE